MNEENIDKLMQKLVEEVNKADKLGEIPVGAIIFDQQGNIISSGFNTRQSSNNVLGHAEINAIIAAEEQIGDWRLNGYSMIVNLEPCDMCSVVINECRLDNVYYLLSQKNEKKMIYDNIKCLNVDKLGNYLTYFSDLLTSFFDNKR